MNATATRPPSEQLEFPGIPTLAAPGPDASWRNVLPGQEVVYLGKISDGPRYGARGLVKNTLNQRAIVDMGRAGTWHIPYYFLAIPAAAD